jgi:hypothetical protein
MRALDPKTYLVEVLSPYVSGSELPDMYERYLLDPDDEDESAIQTRLDDVKAIWDKKRENTKYGAIIRTLSDAHLTAELTLGDADERQRLAAEAAEARKARAESAAKAVGEWRSVLADVVKAGGLDPAKRGSLERYAQKLGLDNELVKRELDAAPVAAAPDVLNSKVREQVREALAELARDIGEPAVGLTLYHALGLKGITQDGATVARLYEKAVTDNKARPIGTTAQLWKNVLSHVQTHLVTNDPRAYIAGVFEDVKSDMEMDGVRAASDGVIEPAEAEALIRRAVELGLTSELAHRVVTAIAKENGASVETGAVVDYVACPACGTPHSREGAPAACRRCATALFVMCPSGCGTKNDATALRCVECKTDLHEYAAATRRVAALGPLVDAGRVGQASRDLADAIRVLGEPAVPADLRRKIDTALNAAEAQWSTIESAISERRLYAARMLLRKLSAVATDVAGPSGDRPAQRTRYLDGRIAEVDQILSHARSQSGPGREAAFIEALRIAADCEDADSALEALPPASPSMLVAELTAGGPVVRWHKSPAQSAAYSITRIDVRSGTTTHLGDTEAASFEDKAAEAGTVVRYDVSTIRGRAKSPVVSTADLVVAREAADVSLSDGDGEVRLSWRALPASARALVFRQADGQGGEDQLVADRNGLVDRDVRNGQRYSYRVAVEYAGVGGQREQTRGVLVFGNPVAPPESVEQLRIRPASGGTIVSFDQPQSGTVTIVRCTSEPAVAAGDPVDLTRLADLGQILSTDAAGAFDSGGAGLCWYVPITVAGGNAIAGRALRHLALPEITNVSAVETPGQIRVTWEWPADVRVAKVIWSRERQPPGPEDPAADSAWVRLGEYRDGGGFTIEASGADPVFIAVVPAVRVGAELISGAAISRGSRAAVRPVSRVDLRYQVRCAGYLNTRLEIEVLAPDGAKAPELLLVGRPGDLLPRTSSDGEVLARLGGKDSLEETVDLGGRSRPLAVRLFLSSSSSGSSYQLFDPSADSLLIK